jgi:NAD(P)H-quinone oxidoreductase subunit 5
VGIIVVEIGIAGFLPTYAATVLRYFALAHIVGHASLRTLQFLRASSLLQDYRMLENAIGQRLPMPAHRPGELTPGLHLWFYRMALERGYFDALLTDYISQPLLKLFRTCDRWERSWTEFLSGGQSLDSDTPSPSGGLEEFE